MIGGCSALNGCLVAWGAQPTTTPGRRPGPPAGRLPTSSRTFVAPKPASALARWAMRRSDRGTGASLKPLKKRNSECVVCAELSSQRGILRGMTEDQWLA